MRFVLLQRTSSQVCLFLGLLGAALGGCDGGAVGDDVGGPNGRNEETFVSVPPPVNGTTSGGAPEASSAVADTSSFATSSDDESETSGAALEEEESGTGSSGEFAGSTAGDGSGSETWGSSDETYGETDTDTDGGDGCPGQMTFVIKRVENPSVSTERSYRIVEDMMHQVMETMNCSLHAPPVEIEVFLDGSAEQMVEPPVYLFSNIEPVLRVKSVGDFTYYRVIHELSHILGVGEAPFEAKVVNGVFEGPLATALVRELSGDPDAVIESDGWVFSPYGLVGDDDDFTEQDVQEHFRVVDAIRRDIRFSAILLDPALDG